MQLYKGSTFSKVMDTVTLQARGIPENAYRKTVIIGPHARMFEVPLLVSSVIFLFLFISVKD